MRSLACLLLLVACAADQRPGPDLPQPIDTVWSQSIHPGDTIVAVPGTGGYTTLGAYIDAASPPVVDWRANHDLNPIVLEQAIAAAHRAGIADADLEAGSVTLALWGAGVTKHDSFTYRSLGGLVVPFRVLGGKSVCAVGALPDNLLNYTRANVEVDARDLYARLPAGAPHITVVAHSWGGAVAEYLAEQVSGGDPRLVFYVAAGVPGAIVGYSFAGPGLRPAGAASLYEVDRPDDPVHTLHLSWDIEGHQYDIMFGDDFRGSYGISTEELSCHAIPGPCAN